MKIDGEWDAATTAAVIRWQKANGLDQTGSIELGRVVFQPGPRRVASIAATLGGPAGGRLLGTTSTRSQVTVALDTSKQSLAETGTAVTVELPSGKDVRGRISSVGRVATRVRSAGQGGSTATGEATIPVTIALSGRASALDRAPATVRFERGRRKDVLAIPVTALLARGGGRFAVEVRDGSRHRLVPVTPGLYTSSYVEITGKGLEAGMKVTDARV